MRIRHLIVAYATVLALSSCDVMKQVSSSYNMINCKYDYNSISGLSLAGMNFSQGLSAANVLQATALLSGGAKSSLPLNFTLNLDVSNPNQTAALLNGMQYVLSIDDVEFTTGSVTQRLDIPAGGKSVLPLTIGVDLAKLLSGDSKNAVTNIAKNFLGIGSSKSNVTIQIKPSFNVAGYTVASPVYIPVSFTFGGK
ncbi:LEA type 2 family protein [Alistipes sp. OttesenSCG-928-B03]|nr:LEA type 2 family protein [Alistipes sp. OttesenSCG-928-B03]